MADIELVIKIPDDLYKSICSDAEIMIYGGMRSGKTLLATLLKAIQHGMVIEKPSDAFELLSFRRGMSRAFEIMANVAKRNKESEE